MINTELLAEICEVAGAPGHEQKVREIVIREVTGLVDEIKTDNLGNIVAIKNNIEYNIGTVLISDVLDYNTFTSDQYSADSTRFYLNGVLYTGVGLIDNMEQYTIINFKKGRLDGLWYERLYRNADNTIKGNYKKGLRNGQWEVGWYDSTQYILHEIVSFKNGLLNGPIIFYAFSLQSI